MEVTIDPVIHETKEHLGSMMAKEKQNGEFLLASVVQDSLLYNFHTHAESPNLMNIAHHAAKIAIESAAEHLNVNEFTIRESIRGVMHSMVNLGGDPAAIAVAVTIGGIAGLRPFNRADVDYCSAVVAGVCDAAEDLGLDPARVRTISEHIARHPIRWDQ